MDFISQPQLFEEGMADLPQNHKCSATTGLTDLLDLAPSIKLIEDHDLCSLSNEEGPHFQFHHNPFGDEPESLINFIECLSKKPRKTKIPKNSSQKNSNVIKKIGRIILNNIQQYQLFNEPNPGVVNMLQLLEKRFQKKKSVKKMDGFNTFHLQALFSTSDQTISKINLQITRRIFSRQLRRQVLNSSQLRISGKKLLYLDTLKCSSLRFMNKMLANRLQISESQQ